MNRVRGRLPGTMTLLFVVACSSANPRVIARRTTWDVIASYDASCDAIAKLVLATM